MKRTELLQEIRRMRFEELYGGWQKGRLSQEEAAQILGVCNRTFRRQICRYEENGLEGLNDRRLTQASHRRAPVDEEYQCAHLPWPLLKPARKLPMSKTILLKLTSSLDCLFYSSFIRSRIAYSDRHQLLDI